jgi:heptaprenyl diphosphate synthase
LRNNGRKKTRALARNAVFLAAALVAGLAERWIPFEFAVPGVKLGLANAVVLTALYLFPQRGALAISLLKCVITAVFAGTGLSFLYSLSGAAFSFAVMAAALRFGREKISPVGVSVLGAVFHNVGQVLAASAVMKTFLLAAYLPVLLLSGVITGVLVGLAVKLVLPRVRKYSRSACK